MAHQPDWGEVFWYACLPWTKGCRGSGLQTLQKTLIPIILWGRGRMRSDTAYQSKNTETQAAEKRGQGQNGALSLLVICTLAMEEYLGKTIHSCRMWNQLRIQPVENQGGGSLGGGLPKNKFQIFGEWEFCTFKDTGVSFFGINRGHNFAQVVRCISRNTCTSNFLQWSRTQV